MTELKVLCSKCGATILDATASKTGGYCIPCKREIDVIDEHNLKQEQKRVKEEQREPGLKKRRERTAVAIWFFAHFFLLFSFAYNFYTNYQRVALNNDDSWPVVSMLYVSGFGAIFMIGVIIYYAFKIRRNIN